MVIGIIDSGKGGLAVVKRLNQHHHYVLVMDQSFFPYGTKSKYFLCCRTFYLVQFLIKLKVDIIILACNTLSILTLSFLKQNIDFPIYGIFDYLIPYLNQNNLFIGSKNTIEYVQNNYHIPTLDGSFFIDAIEKKEDVTPFLKWINAYPCQHLILGCTHFLSLPEHVFLKPTIHQIDLLENDIFKNKKKS